MFLFTSVRRLFRQERLTASTKLLKAPKLKRGVVILHSGATGLYGGKETELIINGIPQRFNWDKAMLLTKPKSGK